MVGEVVPVPGGQCPDQGRRILWEGGVHPLFELVGQLRREIPQREPLRPRHPQFAVSLRPQKYALCGVVGDLLPAEGPLCQGAVGHHLHPVPWSQVRPLFVRIDQRGHRGPRLPVRPDQH